VQGKRDNKGAFGMLMLLYQDVTFVECERWQQQSLEMLCDFAHPNTRLTDTIFSANQQEQMGSCATRLCPQEQQYQHLNMNEVMSQDTILILGASQSGKSTLWRHWNLIYGSPASAEKRRSFRFVIENNVISSMQTLIDFSETLENQIADELLDSKLFVQGLTEDAKIDANIADHIAKLWEDPAIQETFSKSSSFQMTDSAPYFFNRIALLASPNYVPSREDILKCRIRTSGIQNLEISFQNRNLKFIDTGGVRNERKKWKHLPQPPKGYFSAIIFMVDLSEYDLCLFEDQQTNRLREALSVFEGVLSNETFKQSPLLLVFNKMDTFRRKIRDVSLKACFPEYEGQLNDAQAALDFIVEKFKDKMDDRNRQTSIHFINTFDEGDLRLLWDQMLLNLE
jgi:guanine nucleotide-binding protein G(i) subunit alpha